MRCAVGCTCRFLCDLVCDMCCMYVRPRHVRILSSRGTRKNTEARNAFQERSEHAWGDLGGYIIWIEIATSFELYVILSRQIVNKSNRNTYRQEVNRRMIRQVSARYLLRRQGIVHADPTAIP